MNANADLLDALADRLAATIAAKVKAELSQATPGEPWRLWSVADVCERLGRSRRSVMTYVRLKQLPVIKLDDGSLRFDPRDVEEWARSRRIPAAEP